MTGADGADRLADEHGVVGGGDWRRPVDRHLELAAGVLGMDLFHADRLLAERLHHVGRQVVGTLDDPRLSLVGGAHGRRYEVVAGAGVEHPFDLEAHGCLEPLSGCSLDHPGGEAALASAMRLAGWVRRSTGAQAHPG